MSSVPGRVFLAVETSSNLGSVAVAIDGGVVARRFLSEKSRHAERLVGAMDEVLRAAGVTRRRIDGIVVGAGPGSFTGVRIAGAAAKGLAMALDIPLLAASSLAAAALGPEVFKPDDDLPADLRPQEPAHWPRAVDPGDREVRYVLADARRGRVYGGCYLVEGGTTEPLIPAHGGTVVEALNRRPPIGTMFAGDGAWAHEALIRAAGFGVLAAPAGVPTADGLLACRPSEPVDRFAWEPDYVREWHPDVRE